MPSEAAKEKARDWYSSINTNWHECVYEDAAQAGIKITGFDIERGNSCDIELAISDTETAEYILANHGEDCDTYKAAIKWNDAIEALPELPDEGAENYNKLERELCRSRDAIDGQFMTDLSACYLRALRSQYEYSESEEAIAEAMQANGYTFRENGKREDA